MQYFCEKIIYIIRKTIKSKMRTYLWGGMLAGILLDHCIECTQASNTLNYLTEQFQIIYPVIPTPVKTYTEIPTNIG